jgi:hypothetical protein
LARTPVDVYRGLVDTQLDEETAEQINSVVSRFTDFVFAGEKLSIHLTRFLNLTTRLIALLDSEPQANHTHLTMSVDLLDYLTSASKWWNVTRQDPSIVLRPPSREARAFIKSITDLHVGGTTLQRISGATDKLSRFLEEHDIESSEEVENFCSSMLSAWALLSAFACKGQGRNVATEADFETAYDTVRILLFYIALDDFRALSIVRQLGTHSLLPKAASVTFSPGFEKKLNASVAASLEKEYNGYLIAMAKATSGSARSILTNSLRLLGQLQAVDKGIERLEKEHYDPIIIGAIELIERIGVSSDFLQNDSATISLFKTLKPGVGVEEKIQLLIRRLEGLIVDSTGNKDFLLQYARLVPRLIAMILLLAARTKNDPDSAIEDSDIKRGLILLYKLISG